MIEVTVKTLDGKNRSFCVPDDITVKQFKEKIANSIEITAETQRLIYQGRVLQDEKKLGEYDVNGKTIHVVQRPPPSARGPSGASSSASASAGSAPRAGGMQREGNTFVLGSFTLPSDMVDPNHVQNITQQVITGMGDLGRNAHVSTRSANDGSSVDVHIHLGQVAPPQPQSESQLRVDQARRMIQQAQRTLDRLENPPTAEEETSRGSSPMQTASEAPSPPGATADSTPSASASTAGNTTEGQGSSSNNSNNRTGPRSSSRPQSPQHPAPSALNDLLSEAVSLNQRLQPHLERYQRLMADDPRMENEEETRNAQRTFNLVSEALHYVSHAYHSISDLMLDMHRAPPRQLRAAPSMFPQQPMPMQAQINVQTTVPGGTPRTTTSSTSTPASATRTTATSTRPTGTTAPTASATTQTSGPTPAGPQVRSTPLPGGGTANVASSNPYVFMELGPHALTINSISAHVVSTEDGQPSNTPPTAATNTTSSTNTSPTPSAGPRPTATGPTPAGMTPGQPRPPNPLGPQAVHMQIPMGPGGFGGGAGGVMPPDLMQNILQMVTQQAFPRAPGPAPNNGGPRPTVHTSSSSTSSSTSSSSSSSTSQSAAPGSAPGPGAPGAAGQRPAPQGAAPNGSPPGGARQGGMPHAAFVLPGLLPGMGPGMMPVDPHLPCNSHHFMNDRAQMQANNQNMGEGTLGGMMANLVSSLMNQQNPHTHAAGPQRPRGAQNSTSTGSTGTSNSGPRPGPPPFNPFANLFGAPPRPPTAAPGARPGANPAATAPTATAGANPAGEPPFVAAMRQFLQEGQQQQQQQQAPSGGSTPASGGTASATGGELSDETFTQLVRGISNYVAQAALGRPTDTIASFLNSLGRNYNIAPAEGVLMDVFNVVAQNLTFTDIMAVFYGQPGPLQSLQGPLQDMVRERILHNEQPTDENIRQAVETLMTDITPEINTACENARARDGIDIRATLQEFTRHNLRVAIRFIMQSTSSDEQFAQHLYTLCQRVIHEFIVLGVHCLEGREQALQRLIENQMMRILHGVNPAIQQWMVSIPIREMSRLLQEITIQPSEVEHYVRRVPPTAPKEEDGEEEQPSEGSSFMSAESAEFCDPMVDNDIPAAAAQPNNQEAMEVDSPSSSVTLGDSPVDVAAAAADRKLPPPPTADPQDEVSVVIGSEPWHNEVPQEWVPVIARDARRQSREPAQPPFSDAYLHGMPAKRRKIVEKKNDRELTDLTNIVPETLRRAVAAAGVETLTSLEEITQEASVSAPLHSAFERQVCESVRERIQQDADFSAEKFPNANTFFKKGK